jgi:1-phosphofructokinase
MSAPHRPILTLTLNPAIDETVTLDALHPGAVNLARGMRRDAGGKGVNVARCLADWGVPVIATGLLGACNAAIFERLFAARGIEDRFRRLDGDTRTNIKLVHDGLTTDINLPGLPPAPADLDALRATLLDAADGAALVALSGSLPAGVPADFYAGLGRDLAARGARVVLDTSGMPLAAALAGPAGLPFCVKPNRAELEAWAGRSLASPAALIEAAAGLRARGVRLVAISLGADGALFAGEEGTLHAQLTALPPESPLGSTVGAGDAMVAGICAALGEGADLGGIARLATAFAVTHLAGARRAAVTHRAGSVALRRP